MSIATCRGEALWPHWWICTAKCFGALGFGLFWQSWSFLGLHTQLDIFSGLKHNVAYLLKMTVGMAKHSQIINSRCAILLSRRFLPRFAPVTHRLEIDKVVSRRSNKAVIPVEHKPWIFQSCNAVAQSTQTATFTDADCVEGFRWWTPLTSHHHYHPPLLPCMKAGGRMTSGGITQVLLHRVISFRHLFSSPNTYPQFKKKIPAPDAIHLLNNLRLIW